MKTQELPLMLTVEAAGRLAGISRRHAYKLVTEGEIPSVRLGGAIRVPTQRLLEILGCDPKFSPAKCCRVDE